MKAVIIGGGIGGLAAAIALEQAGIDWSLHERTKDLREVGAGLSLWANAIRAVEKLGLGRSFASISHPQITGAIRTWRGEPLTGGLGDEFVKRFGSSLVVVVHRAELHAMLLRKLPSGKVRFGAECTGFKQNDGGVTAGFADGSSEMADVLIGADGLHSVIRARLFGSRKPRYSGYTGWRGVTKFDFSRDAGGVDESRSGEAFESWGHGMRFGAIPMSEGRVYWFATRNEPEGVVDDPRERKNELLAQFRGWHRPVEAIIEATEPDAILRNDIHDREPLQRWSVERVTLLGDAAHPMTPNLGQGACQALEDAVVLGECLSRRADSVEALREYETRRRGRANRIVRQSWRLGRVAQWENRLACGLRAVMMRTMPLAIQMRQLERVIGEAA